MTDLNFSQSYWNQYCWENLGSNGRYVKTHLLETNCSHPICISSSVCNWTSHSWLSQIAYYGHLWCIGLLPSIVTGCVHFQNERRKMYNVTPKSKWVLLLWLVFHVLTLPKVMCLVQNNFGLVFFRKSLFWIELKKRCNTKTNIEFWKTLKPNLILTTYIIRFFCLWIFSENMVGVLHPALNLRRLRFQQI